MFPLAHMGVPLLPLMVSGRMPKGVWLVILGGLLPDLIDKPIGHLLLPENNGRIFAHTLLFAIFLLCMGLAVPRIMPLAYGVLSHQFLDQMFLDPNTALWPLMGAFESSDFDPVQWFDALGDPLVISFEIAGAAALGLWAWRWAGLKQFIMGSNGE